MKYLDERIILTVPSLSIEEDGLYQYEVGIGDEWTVSDPIFVGNCFIPKGATQRNIDITDIVRNEINFDIDVDFQEEWQVRIKVGEEYHYSNSETVLPIYRYPNRKAEMETPIELIKEDWYIPALQGFDAQKKAKLLPHIPYLATKELSYELWMNNGRMTTEPYLYSGVKKSLYNDSYGIRKNKWSLDDLLKSGEEVETIAWDYNQIMDYYDFTIPVEDFNDRVSSLAPLQYTVKAYRQVNYLTYSLDGGESWNKVKINEFPFNYQYGGNVELGDYIDTFLSVYDPGDSAPGDYCLDFYPSITESCKIKADLSVTYEPENYIELFTNTTTGQITGDAVVEPESVATDIFEIEIGKKQAAGDIPDRTFTNLTVGDTIEFDDTSDSQWLKIYNSAGELLDTITFSDVMEEGYFIEYAVKLEVDGTNIALYPLKQVYVVNLSLKNYITPKSQETAQIMVREEKSDVQMESLSNSKYYPEIVVGNGTIQLRSTGYTTTITDWKSGTQLKTKNGYIIKKTGEVYYFTPGGIVNIPYMQIDKIVGVYAYLNPNGEMNIFVLEQKMLEDWFYNRIGFAMGSTGHILINNVNYLGTKSLIYNEFPVSEIDYCPSRYYLQWRDRYGSQQTQPFGKTETYSESLTRSEVKNYQNVRRLANVEIQPKWKINSGWLNDSVYPYYESLFVSPYLKLYDAKEDKSYDVIITDSEYTEKTYKNQGNQLFNLELNLEENKTQKILY